MDRSNFGRTSPFTSPLVVGSEVLFFLDKPVGKSLTRRELIGVGRGAVVAVADDLYRVAVTHSSPRWFVGREIVLARSELYAASVRVERADFGQLIRFVFLPIRRAA